MSETRGATRHKLGLFGRLGVRSKRAPDELVTLEPFPEICARGVVRASVLVLVVDMMAGFLAERGSGTDWVFTTDLSLRTQAVPPPRRLSATGTLLRAGRGSVFSDAVIVDERGAEFAYGQAGFVRMPRRHGDPPKPHLHENVELGGSERIARPLVEEVGVRIVDPARGHVEAEIDDRLRNPAGALQGAMVALIAEAAAEALADSLGGRPQVVTDLDIRYLAMGREGPVHSTAAWIGPPGSGKIRVELRDRGNADRRITAVLARTEPAPGL